MLVSASVQRDITNYLNKTVRRLTSLFRYKIWLTIINLKISNLYSKRRPSIPYNKSLVCMNWYNIWPVSIKNNDGINTGIGRQIMDWIYKWAATWQNQQCGCAPSEDSDLPGRMPRLIWVFAIRPGWSESSLCAQWVAKDPSFLHADSEDSDQTGRMPRLIWVLAGRTLILLVLSCRGSNHTLLFCSTSYCT